MDQILETELCFNNKEENFARKFGFTNIPSSHIFVIENCRRKERRNLNSNFVELLQKETGEMKNKYPDKKVLNIVQFKKGLAKTKEQVFNAIECGKFPGSDGVCLYETNPHQGYIEFKNELNNLIRRAEDYERYFVLEMDAKDILEKVNLVIENGITNFILIAGNYKDHELWSKVLIESILASEGKSIVVLPTRMNTKTKKSFIEKVQIYGPNVIVHGMPFGGGKGENRFLDHKDMLYKIKSSLPTNNTLLSNADFAKLYGEHNTNSRRVYELGRVCSLFEGKIFCNLHPRTITIET